jgi:hypothetical protein
MRRHGLSLAEILIATLVLAGLGVAIQSLMVSTLQGVQVDRVSEVKRNITLDLLERFAHPYSTVDELFVRSVGSPATREMSVAEAITTIGMTPEDAAVAKAILATGKVTGFMLVWHRGVANSAPGSGRTLRLDRLWCHPVEAEGRGARVNSFRVFHVRGEGP